MYYSTVKLVDAYRWFQNGDHPSDEFFQGSGTEGKVVRRYRRPDVDGFSICERCGFFMHDHGWLGDEVGAGTVCPGDWIITTYSHGNAGIRTYHPCKDDIFHNSYREHIETVSK